MKNLTLITGGVRSGKSHFAEGLAQQSGRQVHYLATMPQLLDDREQEQRIAKHRARRPQNWQTVECPYDLKIAIAKLPGGPQFCLIDCLSVYVSNLLVSNTLQIDDIDPYEKETALFSDLSDVLQEIEQKNETNFVIVTNEVGLGVIPETPLGRAFRDFLGLANQKFARSADEVWLTCCGLPMRLKPQQ